MDYISVREAAQKWEISERRVQKLCEESRIDGIQKFGRSLTKRRRNPLLHLQLLSNKSIYWRIRWALNYLIGHIEGYT